jgi:hypothetical protein
MAGASIKWDTREFDATLKRYAQLSKRDPAIICNTKAYFILRGALRNTPKASKARIKQDLMQIGRNGAPLAAAIINSGRKPGLQGLALKRAIQNLIKIRRVATLKAGYIAGIQQLEPFVPSKRGAPPMDRGAKLVGKPKGWAKPASESSWKAVAAFANTGGAKWDTRDTATGKALPGIQQAYDDEERSMEKYIWDKLNDTARKAGIKTS